MSGEYTRRLGQQKEWRRQDEDGAPHISYFSQNTSFIWDGLTTTVQVCDGAAGEPVTDTFEVLPSMLDDLHHPALLLERFATHCERYLSRRH